MGRKNVDEEKSHEEWCRVIFHAEEFKIGKDHTLRCKDPERANQKLTQDTRDKLLGRNPGALSSEHANTQWRTDASKIMEETFSNITKGSFNGSNDAVKTAVTKAIENFLNKTGMKEDGDEINQPASGMNPLDYQEVIDATIRVNSPEIENQDGAAGAPDVHGTLGPPKSSNWRIEVLKLKKDQQDAAKHFIKELVLPARWTDQPTEPIAWLRTSLAKKLHDILNKECQNLLKEIAPGMTEDPAVVYGFIDAGRTDTKFRRWFRHLTRTKDLSERGPAKDQKTADWLREVIEKLKYFEQLTLPAFMPDPAVAT